MCRLVLLCCSLLFAISGVAQTSIPEPLQSWKGWVLEKHQNLDCPVLFNQAEKFCVWPANLDIKVSAQGGIFEFTLEVFGDSWVKLPGDQQNWPVDVMDLNSNQPVIVREKDGHAETFLSKGQYRLQGKWSWNTMPRTLTVPQNTGIISLAIDNKIISSPFLESATQLLLNANKQALSTESQDNLQLNVFRRLQDDVPLKILTQISLDVSGKEREVHLGQALLNDFRLIGFNSDLPARIEKDGSLRVQVKSGSWTLYIESQSQSPVTSLGFNAANESHIWPEQEIWVFAQKPELRSVQISGVASIDPQQTLLPEDWRNLPAYLVDTNTKMTIEELQRGGESAKNQLLLSRKMWLDFNGDGYTVKDSISGELHQGWRLETFQPFVLKSAKADGDAQLITQLSDTGNAGIEIRQRQLNLETISRVSNQGEIPVTGWSSVFNQVSTELVLPPGWSLIAASGTSIESGSWIENWSLWNLFLVLIISLAIGKMIKPLAGLLALITLVLIFHRADAPTWIWLNLVAILALLPYVSGKFRKALNIYLYASFLIAAIIVLPFSVQQAREFFYPQQEFANKHMRDAYYSESDSFNIPYPGTSPAPAMMMEESMDYASSSAPVEKVMGNVRQKLQKQQYDPNQILQTGPGVPEWSWRSVHLQWNGPVMSEETTRLYLVSPLWNRLGSLLSCLLALLLAAVLLKHFLYLIKKQKDEQPEVFDLELKDVSPVAIIALGLIIGFSPMGSGQLQANSLPDEKLLQELETRLTASAKCLPDCASIESITVKTSSNRLWLTMTVHAADKIALPLPGQAPHWWPDSVKLNGRSASLLQHSQGQLFIYLPKGKHQIELTAELESRESIDLNFGLPVHEFSSQLEGWQLNGNTQGAIRSLQLQPVMGNQSAQSSEQLRPDPVPAFVIIRRSFNFDLEWNLHTEVIRVAPAEGVINLEVPLLANESPLDGNTPLQNLSADKQKLQIRLDKQTSSLYWNSRLTQTEQIQLQAAEQQPWLEIWEIQTSPVWHLQTSGIAAIQPNDVNQLPIWQPWPGESLNLMFSRPQAVKGDTMVIESADFTYSPSARASTSRLNLSIKTSQANQYAFPLPEGASLNLLELNGQKLNLSPVQGVLRIPLQPGEQKLVIEWLDSTGVSSLIKTPSLDLGIPTANQSINIQLPERWPLYLSGPSIGPSVLIWGILAVVIVLAIQLGRRQLTPLSSREWVLLALGIATVNLLAILLIAIWLLALQWRSKLDSVYSPGGFKWLQTGLFILSIISLIVLIAVIPDGLLSNPDMHIRGNGSSSYYLRWYQDISEGSLAQAWVISLPIWVYKLVMLIWSLWLASSLIRWLTWGWKSLGHKGFWYWSGKLSKPVETPVKN
nr:hypothetical protein [uncultured bacterium]